jgi:hypothetical protein
MKKKKIAGPGRVRLIRHCARHDFVLLLLPYQSRPQTAFSHALSPTLLAFVLQVLMMGNALFRSPRQISLAASAADGE